MMLFKYGEGMLTVEAETPADGFTLGCFAKALDDIATNINFCYGGPVVALRVPVAGDDDEAGDDDSDGTTGTTRKENHGLCVSTVAKNTPGGPDHGKTVSSVARSDCGKKSATTSTTVAPTTSSTTVTTIAPTTTSTVAGLAPGTANSGKGNSGSSNSGKGNSGKN